jgi:hypothetical protein
MARNLQFAMAAMAAALMNVSSMTAAGETAAMEAGMPASTIQIPQSIRTEHVAIHSALEEATKVAGPVGAAARALAHVLHPHFIREEEIALPPLGLLAPLAAGAPPSDTADILVMTDALRRELPRMLDEHKQIRAAVEELRLAARTARATRYEQLAEQLALHAQTEEEVLYPAAVLVGDIIRMRLGAK